MTDNTANDGRPDVEIRLIARPGGDPRVPLAVTGEAHCRFCPESLLSPDPRTLVQWADAHEVSENHRFSKQERLQQLRDVPPLASGDWASKSRPMMDPQVPWGPDASQIPHNPYPGREGSGS